MATGARVASSIGFKIVTLFSPRVSKDPTASLVSEGSEAELEGCVLENASANAGCGRV